MRTFTPRALAGAAALAATAVALAAPATGTAGPSFQKVATLKGSIDPQLATTRNANGTLTLVYPSFTGSLHVTGLATRTISASGKVGPETQALSGWEAGVPGLVTFPNGNLEAFFGAISPGNNVSSVWGITSSDGGTTWSAPADVRSGPNEALAYGSDVTARVSGGLAVLTLPQAGGLVVQRGLGAGSPTALANSPAYAAAVDVDTAVDAATGEVVASWQSLKADTLVMQGISPSIGTAQAVPGQRHSNLVLAGRDSGPGIFAAYTPDGTHVRLVRYGGGSVAVGSLNGVTAKAMGVATGPAGRIWVMWGDENGGLAVTRSNKAVTNFEPIQHVNPNASSLWRLQGDGRLGPLDLFAVELANVKGPIPQPEAAYARVLAELSMTSSASTQKGTTTLHVTVTDAGDAVKGASVSVKGKKASTNASGVATLTFGAGITGNATATVTSPGYQVLTKTVTL
jgi:hypothetical protein